MQIEEFQCSPAVEEGTAVMASTPPQPPAPVVLQQFQIPWLQLFHFYFIFCLPFKRASILYSWSLASLTHIFSLTSTLLTGRRRSPVAVFFFLTSDYGSYSPNAFLSCFLWVPRESTYSCYSDPITSGNNWWFCSNAQELQDPRECPSISSSTLSTRPQHPLNTNSTGENAHPLCFIRKVCCYSYFSWCLEMKVLATANVRH